MKLRALMASIALFAVPSFALAESLLERIATEILADRFGINTREITEFRKTSRADIWSSGPTFSMSRYGGVSAYEVQRLRASGKGWGQIAKDVGMHPGDFNKLRNQGYFDRDPFWDDIYRRKYGVKQEDITVIRRRGGSLEDVLAAVLISTATGRSPGDIYNRYQSYRDWDRTADYFRFNFGNWSRLGRRVDWDGKTGIRTGNDPVNRPGRGNSGGNGGGKGGGKGGFRLS